MRTAVCLSWLFPCFAVKFAALFPFWLALSRLLFAVHLISPLIAHGFPISLALVTFTTSNSINNVAMQVGNPADVAAQSDSASHSSISLLQFRKQSYFWLRFPSISAPTNSPDFSKLSNYQSKWGVEKRRKTLLTACKTIKHKGC